MKRRRAIRSHQRSENVDRHASALLICNGEPPARSVIWKLVPTVDIVVAADGGANVARSFGITPDLIIGDLDSITPATAKAFGSARLLRVPRQDNTDLEKALDFLSGVRVRRVVIVGATGRRMDFTLANIAVLWSYSNLFDWTVVGDGWYAQSVGRYRSVYASRGTTVSLIPYSQCRGVTLQGLQYPMVNGSLDVGKVAVSNVVRSSHFSVAVKRGKLLLVVLGRFRPVVKKGKLSPQNG